MESVHANIGVWRGYYYDGQSSRRHEVTLNLAPTGLNIVSEDGTSRWWPYAEIRQTQGTFDGGQVRLERGGDLPETLVVTDVAFQDALRRFAPSWRRNGPLRMGGLSLALVAGIAAALSMAGIYVWGIPSFADAVAPFVPTAWEQKLGAAALEEMTAGQPRCDDPTKTRALERLVSELSRALPSQGYRFHVVLVQGETVNAFALPGGNIVVYTGLLDHTERAEEMAGVLAHEMQHVIHRDATRAILREVSLQVLVSALTGDQGSAKMLSTAASLGSLRYNRQAEAAADRDGMALVQAARIDPWGMVAMMRTLGRLEGNIPQAVSYLSDHPQTVERIHILQTLAHQAKYRPRPLLADVDWSAVARD